MADRGSITGKLPPLTATPSFLASSRSVRVSQAASIELRGVQAVWALMARWWEEEGRKLYSEEGDAQDGMRMLDMAAGR